MKRSIVIHFGLISIIGGMGLFCSYNLFSSCSWLYSFSESIENEGFFAELLRLGMLLLVFFIISYQKKRLKVSTDNDARSQ